MGDIFDGFDFPLNKRSFLACLREEWACLRVRLPALHMDEVRSVQLSALKLCGLFGAPGLSDGVVEVVVFEDVADGGIEAGVVVAVVGGEAELGSLEEEAGEQQKQDLVVDSLYFMKKVVADQVGINTQKHPKNEIDDDDSSMSGNGRQ